MNEKTITGCDLLVLSPHPDDAEIGLGGTLKLLSDKGRRCWVVDLTAGELGSNATPELRWKEACDAAEVLGIYGRARLSLPDGFINKADMHQVMQVAHVIRCLRPRWVITAPDAVRHPDHIETPRLVAKACFMAGLINFETTECNLEFWDQGGTFSAPAKRWKVGALGRVCAESEKPSLYFDISSTWETKTKSLACYASQFQRSAESIATHINAADFLPRITARAQRWGRMSGVDYAESILMGAAPLFEDLPEEPWK
jgi:N-acetylglucosamine malate deacetylase 1